MDRHADDIDVLEQLGLANLDAIEATISRYDIECNFERNGVIDVAHFDAAVQVPRGFA